jgi:hypothetical protein
MKIALVCQSLEPGRSGVGDYTWRLAAALGKMGHDATVVSFWDGFVKAEVNGERLVGCESVRFHRLPEAANGAATRVSQLLEKLKSAWIASCGAAATAQLGAAVLEATAEEWIRQQWKPRKGGKAR